MKKIIDGMSKNPKRKTVVNLVLWPSVEPACSLMLDASYCGGAPFFFLRLITYSGALFAFQGKNRLREA